MGAIGHRGLTLGFVLVSLLAAAVADAAKAQAGSERVIVLCTVTAQGLSKNCRFDYDIDDDVERLKAGTELGFLDTHPFPIPGGVTGSDVKVMVRLNVSPAPDRNRFIVSAPDGALPLAALPVITDPVWVQPPSGRWADQYIPDAAAQANEIGYAVVACIARESGVLGDCWIEAETPPYAGFGAAGMRVLERAHMKSMTDGRATVAGRPYEHVFKYAGWGERAPAVAFEPSWAP